MFQRPFLALVCLFSFGSLAHAQGGGDENFRRGDANGDGTVNLSDFGYISSYVNRGDDPPACFDAADVDDDGDVDNADAVYIFSWYAQGGPQPPSPGPFTCGEDPTVRFARLRLLRLRLIPGASSVGFVTAEPY